MEILPLALTMMVGPQIITAIILVTAKNVVKPSLAYITGVATAALVGTSVFFAIGSIFNLQDNSSNEPSQTAIVIQTIIIGLLVIAALKTFINREKITLPKWMSELQSITPRRAFKVGLMLILFMPTDIAVMLTVGLNLASHSSTAVNFLPFWALTIFIAALPLITYLIFHKRAVKAMPKVRAWMESNSWVVSLAAYLVFIYLLW